MNLTKKIRQNLSKELLSGKYHNLSHHPLAGHCYVASEAAHHLLKRIGVHSTPMQATVDGISHWWLRLDDGSVLDITSDQFDDPAPFYKVGKGKGFLTKKPSKRAQILIDRVSQNQDARLS